MFPDSPQKDIVRRTTTFNSKFDDKKNLNRKKLSLILGPMKTKTKAVCRKHSEFIIRRKKEEDKKEVKVKPQRFDNFGTLICKKNKRKVKIYIPENFEKVIEIESFKNLNYFRKMPREYIPQQQIKCQCCLIF